MKHNSTHIIPILLLVVFFAGCNTSKYLNEGDYVLSSNHFDIESANEGNNTLGNPASYAVQSPNKRFLGVRLKMRLYCISTEKNTWVNRTLRKNGEAPVVYNENAAHRTQEQLKNLMVSKGCFNSSVSFDTIHLSNKNLRVNYHLRPSARYKIDQVTYHSANAHVQQLINNWKAASLIESGDYYDQDIISKERERIAGGLQNEGYYYASVDNVVFLLDTSFSDNTMRVSVVVKDILLREQSTHQQHSSLQQYLIKDIFVYPQGNTTNESRGVLDTIIYPYTFRNRTTNYHFITNQEMVMSPQVITRSLFLFGDQLYQRRSVERSYNSLLNLRNFKYINFEFTPTQSDNDSLGALDASIRLINNTRRKLSFSLEINNASPTARNSQESNYITSGNLGFEAGVSYQNRNLFGGAELLKVDGSFLIEMPKFRPSEKTGMIGSDINAFETGLNASLDIPKMLLPSRWEQIWQRSKPHTVISAGINYQNREYFTRALLNTSFGYSWSSNSRTQHQVLPIEITFARFFDIDKAFWNRIESIASNGRLKYQYSSHFIVDARYDYVYSSQRFNSRRDFTYFHISLENAGLLTNALSQAFNAPKDSSGIITLYEVPFSQYVRVNGELKHYTYLGTQSTFVSRLQIGAGIPYGNSNKMQMPYEKSFFGGGPTTMRAWHLRRLGPGYYSPSDNTLLERTGDITFVLNLEERFPIIGIFEGALFTDVGNVWLFHDNPEYPGGEFTMKDFIPSMAVGIGAGLRAKLFSMITLRLDVGLPAYDPGFAKNVRFRVPYWKEYEWDWKKSYFGPLTFNFGIDYPF